MACRPRKSVFLRARNGEKVTKMLKSTNISRIKQRENATPTTEAERFEIVKYAQQKCETGAIAQNHCIPVLEQRAGRDHIEIKVRS